MINSTECDYCGLLFDADHTGITAGAESGAVIVKIDGVENYRNDEVRMSFCSTDHFKAARDRYSWGYNQDKTPLKNQPLKS